MTAIAVFVIGLICGFSLCLFITVPRIEEAERRMFKAQEDLANLRAVNGWTWEV